VYGIVQNHGGHVTLKSQLGKGTTLSIWLPITEPSPRIDQHETAVLGLRDKRAALILDDQPLVLTAVMRLVRSLGFEPLAASTTAEGVKLLRDRAEDIQLVLIDCQMRGPDGQAAFWSLQQVNAEVPSILLSGYDRDDRAQEMLAAGASCFLRKPFTRIDLKAAVDKALGTDLSEVDELRKV